MTLQSGSRLGPYEVLGPLGAGGMGEVYEAKDPRLDRRVAVKVLKPDVARDPDRLGRFTREAKAVAALNHPNILTVHDVGLDYGTPYVVTELLEGESLREVLSRRSPTQRQALSWAMQITQGLAAAHQKGIVHRDLKPENLFLTTEGRIKILDFGLAKLRVPEAFDSKELTASNPSEPGVVLGTIGYMSPEQVQGCPVDVRSDIFSFGVVLYELLAKKHPFRQESGPATLGAILTQAPAPLAALDPSIPKAVDGIVARCLEKRPESRFQGAHDLGLALEAVLAPTGSAVLDEVEERSPYPGLSSFTEADARHFFGRETEVKELWEKVRARRMLAVIGPSGAGKTSFVRAGVVAGRPAGWAAIVSTPGSAPLRSLGQALGPELSRDPEALRKIAGFESPDTAFELIARWRKSHDSALVVVDQFEELFTLNPPEMQARFASLLGQLAAEADVHILLSLRDDFLMRCHEHASLASVFGELTPLGAMTREGLRRAVVEPARKQGYRLEDEGLVDEIAESAEGARAALPLLAFAVSRLWERRDRERKLLTREAYREIGGVEGALAQHAEATMDRIGPEREGIVREILRNLTTAQGTRGVLDREELLSALPDRAVGESVLGQLVDARLLTSWETEKTEGEAGGHRVEILHESLLKAWPRLVRWQTQDADGALLRDQLRQAARLWQERDKTEDLLWTGASYLDYRAWRERYPGGLSAVEEEFAKAMANKARRKRRLLQTAAVAALVVLTGVAIAIGVSRQKAILAARRAEASKLLAIAQLKLQEDPTEALAYATASLELADTSAARLFALRALQEAPPAWEVLSEWGAAIKPTFSPDGRHLAVSSASSAIRVWRENGGEPVQLPGHETSVRGGPVAAWASPDLLVTGNFGKIGRRVYVWAMPAGTKLRTIDFGAPSAWQVGPERLFAQAEVQAFPGIIDLRSWRLPDGGEEALGRLDSRKLGMTSSAFEPHGRGFFYTVGTTTRFIPFPMVGDLGLVFSQHRAGVVFETDDQFEVGTPLPPDLLGQHDDAGENRLLFFPENGPPVATVLLKPVSAPARAYFTASDRWVRGIPFQDARLRLWETNTLAGARSLELRRGSSWNFSFSALDRKGRLAVAATHNMSRLTFWPLPPRRASVVDGYKAMFRPVSFSPDSKWLVTSWADNRLRLWALPETGSTDVKVLNVPAVEWTSLAFDPGEKYLFAVGNADNAWIVPLDGSPGRKLEEYSKDTLLSGCAVSPSGRRVATAFYYGKGPKTLRVWDVQTGNVRLFDLPVPPSPPGSAPQAETGFEGGVESLAFLDESTLFTAGSGGVRRWNLESGTFELLQAVALGHSCNLSISTHGHEVLYCDGDRKLMLRSTSCSAIDLRTGSTRPIGVSVGWSSTASLENLRPDVMTQGPAFVLTARDGSVRVGLRSGGELHWLFGHTGAVGRATISPDLRWIVSAGEDKTLRLWPMPDLSKRPLHTLPHDELLTKLRSLTNLRAVRDSASSTGWKIELSPFPGWAHIPEWEP